MADRPGVLCLGVGRSTSAGTDAIGPILMGMRAPIHVLQQGVDVPDILNMAAYGVVEAQTKSAAEGHAEEGTGQRKVLA